MADTAEVTVLVVDDEPDLADAYARFLGIEYDTRVAYGGEEALEVIDDGVDVLLLDRRMPDRSGDEVLEAVREAGYECHVIMVTAVDPDFDIVEMPFDEYLCKPVDSADLIATVENQLAAEDYDERLREFISLSAKIDLLEAQKEHHELSGSSELRAIRERADELERDLLEALGNGEDPKTVLEHFVG